MVPVFTGNRLIGLASSSAPAVSPQVRRSPSSWPSRRHRKPATKSSTTTGWTRTAPRPISTRFEPVTRLRGFATGSSRIPSDLARRTRPVWQSQAVPALSALLATLPGVSRIRLRPAPTELLRQPGEEVLHLLRFPAPHGALRPRVAPTIPRSVSTPHCCGNIVLALAALAICTATAAQTKPVRQHDPAHHTRRPTTGGSRPDRTHRRRDQTAIHPGHPPAPIGNPPHWAWWPRPANITKPASAAAVLSPACRKRRSHGRLECGCYICLRQPNSAGR
jgi:hypothetical protein